MGANVVVEAGTADIVKTAEEMVKGNGEWSSPFGDGTATKQIFYVLNPYDDLKMSDGQ